MLKFLDKQDKNTINILKSLKIILWNNEYSSGFNQRLAEGFGLIHTSRRVLTYGNEYTELLVSLFGDNKSVITAKLLEIFPKTLFNELIEIELLKKTKKDNLITSTVRILPVNQFFLLIPFRKYLDPPIYIGADTLTFFRHIQTYSMPKNILDLATGSGYQLFALPWHGSQTQMKGFDINPHAVSCASLNAKFNDTPWITFEQKDITKDFQNIREENDKFDLIIGNPPIIPTPQSLDTRLKGMVHADGGEDGFEIVRKFLPNIPNILKNDGSLQLILSSIGNNEKPNIFEEINSFAKNFNLTGQIVVLKKIPVELDSYYRGQKNFSEYKNWMTFYKSQKSDYWYRLILRLKFSSKTFNDIKLIQLFRTSFNKSPNRERITKDNIKRRLTYYLTDTLMQKSDDFKFNKAKESLLDEINNSKAFEFSIRDFGIYLYNKFPDIFQTEGAAIRWWGQCTNEFWWKPKYLERVLW